MNRTLVIAIGIVIAICLGVHFYAQWDMKRFEASLPKPPAVEQEPHVAETETAGHWHGDEWHDEPHEGQAIVPDEALNGDESHAVSSDEGETIAEPEETLPEPSEPPVEWEDSDEARHLAENFTREWNAFEQQVQSKYHVLFNPEELTRIAQTRQGRRELKSQARAMINETLDKLEELLTQLPPEMSHKLLDTVEEAFQQNNPGIPPEYLKESLEMIRARLN